MTSRQIVVRLGDQVVARYDLPPGIYKIGRSSEGQKGRGPEISIPEAARTVSKRHCHIIVGTDDVEIIDGWPNSVLNSAHGVHLAGQRVERGSIVAGGALLGDPTVRSEHVVVELVDQPGSASPPENEKVSTTMAYSPSAPGNAAQVRPQPEPVRPAVVPVPAATKPSTTVVPPSTPASPPTVMISVPSAAIHTPRQADEPLVPSPEPDRPSPTLPSPDAPTAAIHSPRPAKPRQADEPLVPSPEPDRPTAPTAPLTAESEPTEIATKEAELDVLRGISRGQAERAELPDQKAGFQGRRFRLHQLQQELVIGREPSCDVVLFDPDQEGNRKISRQHARVEYRPEEGLFRLYNRSGNGTVLRRLPAPVMGDTVLNDRDVMVFGKTEIQIRISGYEESGAAGGRRWLFVSLMTLAILLVAGGLGLVGISLSNDLPWQGSGVVELSQVWTYQADSRSPGAAAVGVGPCTDPAQVEVVVATADGSLQALQGLGGNPVWPDPPRLRGTICDAPVVADLDGDGRAEVVVATGEPDQGRGELSLVNGNDGEIRWHDSPGCDERSCAFPARPALADIDGDGVKEIVAGGMSDYTGFVVAVDSQTGNLKWRFPGPDSTRIGPVRTAVAVGEVGAGQLCVVAASDDNKVYALAASDGSLIAASSVRSAAMSAPALGDVDGDGDLDVVVLNDEYAVIAVDGAIANLELGTKFMDRDIFPLPARVLRRVHPTAPVLSDLDGDGCDDVLVANPGRQEDVNILYALNGKNFEVLWSVDFGDRYVLVPPAAADLNRDGVADAIVVVSDLAQKSAMLQILSGQDRQSLGAFELEGGMAGNAGPIVADVNRDGTLDLAMGLEQGGVVLLSLAVQAPEEDPWPHARGDIGNSARLAVRPQTAPLPLLAGGASAAILGLILLASVVVVRRRNRWAYG